MVVFGSPCFGGPSGFLFTCVIVFIISWSQAFPLKHNERLENVEGYLDYTDISDGEDLFPTSILEEEDYLDEHSMRKKRLTMDFNGVRVSYPQYLRLVRLQDKVIKLGQMIDVLRSRYSEESLNKLPQFHRLVALHMSLMPLLPQAGDMSISDLHGIQGYQAEKNTIDSEPQVSKRAPMSVDFMGMRISYPQYLRLKHLQAKVIKLDMLMRSMLARMPLSELEKEPQWHTLVSLYGSLKKMLPPEYLKQFNNSDPQGKRATIDFNGFLVSYPQYLRLKELQRKVIKLDLLIKKLQKSVKDLEVLKKSQKWRELVALRDSLSKLLPHNWESQEAAVESLRNSPLPTKMKKGGTMEFNGVQVSYPQYSHLMKLQGKVMKLDSAMKVIASKSSPEALMQNPKWQTLLRLRHSLENLLPGQDVDEDQSAKRQ